MIWWFLVLALSAGAVLWASISAYFRIRRHMKVAVGPNKPDDSQNSPEEET
jgi:hypothetical protein